MRGRVGSAFVVITQVSSGNSLQEELQFAPSGIKFVYIFGATVKYLSTISGHEGQELSSGLSSFWSGQAKHVTKTPTDPSRTGTFQIVSGRTDGHARPHPHRRTQHTQTHTDKSIRAGTRTRTCRRRRTKQQFCSPTDALVTVSAKSRRAHSKI